MRWAKCPAQDDRNGSMRAERLRLAALEVAPLGFLSGLFRA
jgi:hypothetical protein